MPRILLPPFIAPVSGQPRRLEPPVIRDAVRLRADLHLLLPLCAYALLCLWWTHAQGDVHVARRLLAWQGGSWALKHDPWLEAGLHRGGRWLAASAWLGLLAFVASRWRDPAARSWRRPALALLLSVLACAVLAAWLKSATRMDCPWDLAGLGGTRPFVPLFAARPAGLPKAACFPAAHAAVGYAWVALYFFAARVSPRWRWRALGVGVAAGLLFGFAQQLRGAHFVSHDAASLMLCWSVAFAVDRWVAAPRATTATGGPR